jgi:hypothetical protein
MAAPSVRSRLRRACAGLALACIGPWGGPSALAQADAARVVYRCPGPPVLYTDALAPEAARARGCQVIDAGPLTVGAGAPRAPGGAAGGAAGANSPASPSAPAATTPAPSTGGLRVDPAVQRARDAQARRILEAELRTEEQRLSELRREYADGQPERRGDERNYARYLQRVEELRAAIARKEADLAAIRRELSRLPP